MIFNFREEINKEINQFVTQIKTKGFIELEYQKNLIYFFVYNYFRIIISYYFLFYKKKFFISKEFSVEDNIKKKYSKQLDDILKNSFNLFLPDNIKKKYDNEKITCNEKNIWDWKIGYSLLNNVFLRDIFKNFLQIINIDVGLGKTLISLGIIKIINNLFISFFKTVIKENSNDEYLNQFIKLFNIYHQKKENKLIEEFDNDIFDINIITKAYIKKEFESMANIFFKNHYKVFSNGYIGNNKKLNSDNYEYCFKLFSNIILYFLGKNEGIEEKYIVKLYNTFKKDRYCLFIVDEWGTDKAFFGSGKNNIKVSLQDHRTIFGLTANINYRNLLLSDNYDKYLKKDNLPYGQVYNFNNQNLFLKKESIIDELISKGLYKKASFLYKNIKYNIKYMKKFFFKRSVYINNSLEIIENIKKSMDIYQENIKNVIQIFNDFLNNKVSSNDLNNELKNILKNKYEIIKLDKNKKNQIKGNKIGNNNFTYMSKINKKISNLLLDYKKIKHDMEIMNKKFFYDLDISKYLEELNINYIFNNKNTVIIFDENRSQNKISDLKKYLKDNGLKVVGKDGYKNVNKDNKSNVLVGKVNEISEGLNLQKFDNVVLFYVNSMRIRDIHQSIGRLDRIGTYLDKEVYLINIGGNDSLIDNIIEKRKKINGDINIGYLETIKDLKVYNNVENYSKFKNIKDKLDKYKNDIENNIKEMEYNNDRFFDKINTVQSSILINKENEILLKNILKDIFLIKDKYEKFEEKFTGKKLGFDDDLKNINNILKIF